MGQNLSIKYKGFRVKSTAAEASVSREAIAFPATGRTAEPLPGNRFPIEEQPSGRTVVRQQR